MRLTAVVLLMAGSGAFGQQRPNPTGWGSVLYPGTGGPPPASAHGGFGSVLYPGTGGAPGARGRGSRPIAIPPPVAHTPHSRGVVVPYPVYYGGYYYGGDAGANSQYSAPAYDSGYGDAAPGQLPVVIINQAFRADDVNPVLRDYSNTPLPEPGPDYRPAGDQPTIYLLAMTDHTIVPAIAYWVDGDTLNYITTEGSQNRVSVSLIDREFSRQLNDSRRVEFKLRPRNKANSAGAET